MEERTSFELFRSLQGELNARLRALKVDTLSRAERELVGAIRQQLAIVRSEMHEHQSAETQEEKSHLKRTLKESLEELQQQLLQAGNYGMLGAADVAITSALSQQLIPKV